VVDCFAHGSELSGPVDVENLSVEGLFNIDLNLILLNEVARNYTIPFQIMPPYIPSRRSR
jgi:hypothetical protein